MFFLEFSPNCSDKKLKLKRLHLMGRVARPGGSASR
jgi:hypothetical protein